MNRFQRTVIVYDSSRISETSPPLSSCRPQQHKDWSLDSKQKPPAYNTGDILVTNDRAEFTSMLGDVIGNNNIQERFKLNTWSGLNSQAGPEIRIKSAILTHSSRAESAFEMDGDVNFENNSKKKIGCVYLCTRENILVREDIQTSPNSMGLRCLITEFLWPPSSSIIRLWLPYSTKVLVKTNQTSPNSMGLRRLITEFLWPPSSSIIRLWLHSTKVLGKTNQTSPNSMGLRRLITEFLWPPSSSIIRLWLPYSTKVLGRRIKRAQTRWGCVV
ncbi:hypothetical protein EVAR_64468_1 [Eumeta japonica]|uniref:Uncharacterized protein n=1 Tax=Eumeta variegata TaxID=151549 RepID=A0A4C1ZF72_EUMVA|nr:hypothetical protein EVAR_64468_1 [Eumeta japonica]